MLLNLVSAKGWPGYIKAASIRSIGKFGSCACDCVDKLLPKLFSTKVEIHKAAGLALDQISDSRQTSEELDPLVERRVPKLLSGSQIDFSSARHACCCIGEPSVGILIESLKPESLPIPERAATIPGDLGQSASCATALLQEVSTQHSSRFVREACQKAIQKIRGS